MKIHLRETTWRGFDIEHAIQGTGGKKGATAWAMDDPDDDDDLLDTAKVRRFVVWLPYIGLRVVGHEIEHILAADFHENEDHHARRHLCIRSMFFFRFGWRHATHATKDMAKELRRRKVINVDAKRLNGEAGHG